MNRKSASPINALCVKTIIIATVKTNKIGQKKYTNKQTTSNTREKKESKTKNPETGREFLFSLSVAS